MDVLSLLKFWKNAGGGGGGGDTLSVRDYDYDSSFDDEESFFDLVLTDNDKENDIETKSSFRFVSPEEVFVTNNKKTPQSPFRMLLLGLQNTTNKTKQKEVEQKQEEVVVVKIGALLKRDNSLRHKLQTEKLIDRNEARTPSKRFSKDLVNKYLNIMKPSKRSNEKSRFSDKCSTPSSSPASSVFSPRKEEKKGGRGAAFKGVRKHLGKSRSASAILQTPLTRSDDSALEQQNSIQGAILHCKKSYNSPSQDCCVLQDQEVHHQTLKRMIEVAFEEGQIRGRKITKKLSL